jgi:hypothetical protein
VPGARRGARRRPRLSARRRVPAARASAGFRPSVVAHPLLSSQAGDDPQVAPA